MALDHGTLNLPLAKRGGGSIDRQIDRWKAEQAKGAKAEAKAGHMQRLTARALVAGLSDDRLAAIATKAGLTPKQALAKLRSMATFDAGRVITYLSPSPKSESSQ